METERCKISLNSPESIYFAGQQIKGQVSLTLIKRTKIRGIKFRITGKGKCNWVEFLRRDSQVLASPSAKPNPRSIIYTAKETYILEELYIFGSNNGRPIELEPGEHTYELTYELDKNLPSSFSGSHGSIKYKTKFIIEKPWTLNEKYTVPITIVKSFPMPPAILNTSSLDRFYQVTRNVGVFGGGPISLAAELPKSYVVRGGKLKLKVTVENKSGTHVDRLKFSIKQIVTYYSEQPLCLKKDQITKLFKKETGGIQKKSTREYEHELQVPSCQPSDVDFSKIIHVKYEVQVEAILPGLHKNISVSLPFFVCSAEYNPVVTGGIGWFAYPNPNVSIYSEQSLAGSPSHSMYSDNQSIYSANYDSSISDDSVRLSISTSTRRSFRNSIGFDIQQRHSSSDESTTGTLNHQRNHSISNSNPSSYHQYCPELPPSYEELFGSPSMSTSAEPSAPPLSSSSPTGAK
ncbi:arrestin domain-containing protein 3 [Condylostylus longicornis]|uniref:arrestin domain-containing protein 3 n=1 Tax=Condylostylus longicornis TaxID=2530218 RepID=UPI00244E1244|nr:arrestin domain-containing protein 3 [Condylostylus longicornis]